MFCNMHYLIVWKLHQFYAFFNISSKINSFFSVSFFVCGHKLVAVFAQRKKEDIVQPLTILLRDLD